MNIQTIGAIFLVPYFLFLIKTVIDGFRTFYAEGQYFYLFITTTLIIGSAILIGGVI